VRKHQTCGTSLILSHNLSYFSIISSNNLIFRGACYRGLLGLLPLRAMETKAMVLGAKVIRLWLLSQSRPLFSSKCHGFGLLAVSESRPCTCIVFNQREQTILSPQASVLVSGHTDGGIVRRNLEPTFRLRANAWSPLSPSMHWRRE